MIKKITLHLFGHTILYLFGHYVGYEQQRLPLP